VIILPYFLLFPPYDIDRFGKIWYNIPSVTDIKIKMLSSLRQLAVLNKIFNIRKHEWPRVWIAWFIRLFYRFSFVLGWTVLVVMFVSKFGIASLPYLLVLNAIFTVIGSFFYSSFLDHFKKHYVMIASVLVAGLLLFIASRIVDYNIVLFFSLLIVSIAIFLFQFRISLSGYVEEMFSPLESERTFPLIEGADTVGGFLAGLLVISFSSVIEITSFIYLWLGVLFMLIPLLLINEQITNDVASIKERSTKHAGLVSKFKDAFSESRHISFIKGLFVIVFLQWFIFNLLEFQYTKAVYSNVSSVVMDAGSGFEHAFIHDLGALFILFSVSAFFVQLFIGSRVLDYLGVVGTMLVHVLLTFLSLLGLSFSFNYYTAVLARNNFTIGSVLFNNAYHTSYYAIKDHLRDHVRELLEGVIRPFGALVGTFALIILQYIFAGDVPVFYINYLMLFAAGFLFYVLYSQQKKYTHLAINDLLHSKDIEVRINAVSILAQKGHKNAGTVLKNVLFDESESISLRIRIIKSLADINDPESIADLIQCFSFDNLNIRKAALDSLAAFKGLKGNSKSFIYKKYQLIEALRALYSHEKNPELISKIIHLMSKLSNVATITFLLSILKTSKLHHKAEIIYALKGYSDPDLAYIVKPFLKSKSIIQQINASIVLYNFPKFRHESLSLINNFLLSDSVKTLACGLFAVGELKLFNKFHLCHHYLDSKHKELRLQAAIALAKLGFDNGIAVIVDLLLAGNEDFAVNVKNLLQNVDVRIYKNIDTIISQLVKDEVERVFLNSKAKELALWKPVELLRLRRLYSLVEEYEQVEQIDNYINN